MPDMPTLPVFNDEQDEIDSYLERFERYATLQRWDKSDWAMILSSLLTGKSLDVYARLSNDDAMDYDKIKSALQKRYSLTEEGYRVKFRSSVPKEDENAVQFITWIGKYLDKWIELGKATDCDHEMLKTLLIKEQFLNMCNKNLAIHLKEDLFINIQGMCNRADRYLQAHNVSLGNNDQREADESNGPHSDSNTDQRQSHTEQRQRKTCYNCGKLGHVRANCRNKGGGNEQECSKCKMFGHLAETCRNTSEFGGMMRTRPWRRGKPYRRGIKYTDINIGMHKKPKETDNQDRHKIMKGRINGHIGNTLRDSGCSTVCINKFVKPEQLSGKYQPCTMLDGTKRRFETATVDIDTPYLKQNQIQVLCVENLGYDIVVGDVPQARCKCDPDPNWKAFKHDDTI